MSSFIPESAPFNEEQRAWLNGFFAGLAGMQSGMSAAATATALGITPPTAVDEEDFPWHDPTLPIVDRMDLAKDKPLERKLMASMAQLDCGSCGYLCQTYGEAIASGEETNLTLCSPGGKETKQSIKRLIAESNASPKNANGKDRVVTSNLTSNDKPVYSRQNPFEAKLIESRPLNLEGSAKDTRHVVIDLSGSNLTYKVGDALGVYPTNCEELANLIVSQLAADPNATVTTPLRNRKTLVQALCNDCCLKDPSDELIELLVDRVANENSKKTLALMLEEGVPDGFDVLDVLEIAGPATVTPTEILETLEPLNPRLYSIASSRKCVGDQVHLTIGKVVFEREGRVRKGVASTMLAERVKSDQTVRVFVQPNHAGFTTPEDPNQPMIMVGPGTGIAPFIAFLQERAETKAPGKNWLFFGDQHEAFDFLYESELREYQQSGMLSRLDTAFSRDGKSKVYVQDRMQENGAEIWQWLQSGASFYVCGDASRMAKDVDCAICDLVALHGEMTAEKAKAFVKQLAADGRYHRDVY
ncbi:Sulfite reductase [NADPH] flavoprotein alpha-component [Planctomycetes bacterium CA13]|uniref:assimilatory sulfite reductase (NADPH) n=1 Tax=Novipirellula herctigrandis TaxID=2527986 RepID=A0A5C5Z831_9BACT|nr:Sulfite reductase [NADPH] flavoprotein alpha-component [Planctomycetes bacterium CA13]